jgi:hypothetical protein
VARFLGLQVPLAFVGAAVRAPAESDGAVGQYDLAAFVEGHRLPLGVVGLAQLAVEVRRAHVAVRHGDDSPLGRVCSLSITSIGMSV